NAAASTTSFTMGAGNASVQPAYLDVQAPTVPNGLGASNVTPTSFLLSWNASTDNVAVALYEVRRDGGSLGVTTSLSMALSSLATGASFQMSVRARDAASNWSAWSPPLAVTVGEVPPNDISNQNQLNIHIPTSP